MVTTNVSGTIGVYIYPPTDNFPHPSFKSHRWQAKVSCCLTLLFTAQKSVWFSHEQTILTLYLQAQTCLVILGLGSDKHWDLVFCSASTTLLEPPHTSTTGKSTSESSDPSLLPASLACLKFVPDKSTPSPKDCLPSLHLKTDFVPVHDRLVPLQQDDLNHKSPVSSHDWFYQWLRTQLAEILPTLWLMNSCKTDHNDWCSFTTKQVCCLVCMPDT